MIKDFMDSYQTLKTLEYGSLPEMFLHKHESEKTYTIGGVYRYYNRYDKNIDWEFIDNIINVCDNDYIRSSVMLYHDSQTTSMIMLFFKEKYWNPLDMVKSGFICNKIFLNSILFGRQKVVRMCQTICGCKEDGIIGKNTSSLLNNIQESVFDALFIDMMDIHIDKLLAINSKNIKFENGWRKRIRM